MKAITISRQMGSLGCETAHAVAECLGYRVLWREVINQAALRARTPEVALATIDELDLLGLRPPLKEIHAYHQAVRELMHELAASGNVILVGRAGQVILRGVPGVLHVRLYAPFEIRVERIAKRNNVSTETARAQVETSDEARRRYLRRYYHVRWDDPELYDLMINTAHLSGPEAAAIICAAVIDAKKISVKPAPTSESASCEP